MTNFAGQASYIGIIFKLLGLINLEQLEKVNSLVKEILFEIKYDSDIYALKPIVEKRVNDMILNFQNKILAENLTKEPLMLIKEYENFLINKEAIVKRLKHNKYNFISLKNELYVFDLSYQSKNCYRDEFMDAVKDTLSIFFQDNIIEVIGVTVLVDNLRTYSSDKFENKLEYFRNALYSIIARKIDIILLSTVVFMNLLIYFFTTYKINIDSNSEETISLSIIGALVSFLGFGVVFFQLSYDNLKKTYAYYAKDLLFNSMGIDIILVFFLNLLLSLTTAIFSENNSFLAIKLEYAIIRDVSFNLAIIFFVYFTVKLFLKVKKMIDFSLSPKEVNKLIININVENLDNLISNHKVNTSLAKIFESYEKNPVEIINEISYNLILQNNYRLPQTIIEDLTLHYTKIIEDNASKSNFLEIAEKVTVTYVRTINLISSTSFKGDFDTLIAACYNSVLYVNFALAIYKSNAQSVVEITNLLRSLINDSLKYNKVKQLQDGLDCYSKCMFDHIRYNIPQKFEIAGFFQQMVPKSGENYIVQSKHWGTLFTLATHDFYNLTQDGLDDIGKIDKLSVVEILSSHSIYLNRIVYLSSLGHSQKHFTIDVLSNYVFNLYIDAFNKGRINAHIQLKSPFNLQTTIALILMNEEIASIIYNNYLKWIKFFLLDFKNEDYVKEGINDYLGFIKQVLFRASNNEFEHRKIDFMLNSSLEIFKLIDYRNNFLSKNFINDFIANLNYLELILKQQPVEVQNKQFLEKLTDIILRINMSDPDNIDDMGNYKPENVKMRNIGMF